MSEYRYKIRFISESDHLVFIESSAGQQDFDDSESFIHLLSVVKSRLGGNIRNIGWCQYLFENDEHGLIFQWDDLFGIVIIYPDGIKEEQAVAIICDYFRESFEEKIRL